MIYKSLDRCYSELISPLKLKNEPKSKTKSIIDLGGLLLSKEEENFVKKKSSILDTLMSKYRFYTSSSVIMTSSIGVATFNVAVSLMAQSNASLMVLSISMFTLFALFTSIIIAIYCIYSKIANKAIDKFDKEIKESVIKQRNICYTIKI